jgi:hypothetical protein
MEDWCLVGTRVQYLLMDYEYAPLRLPSNVDRLTATAQLTIQAEFGGWELARVRLFPDGTRQVVLRRSVSSESQPGLSI